MRTILTTADGIPIRDIPTHEAILKLLTGKVVATENHPTRVFRSQHLTVPAPIVVSSLKYVKLPKHFYGSARLTNQNLFLRDNFTCGYCGKIYSPAFVKKGSIANSLTRDHIVPTSRGGKDIWENVVTACISCNNKKGDKLLKDTGMELNVKPTVPQKLVLVKRKAAYRLAKHKAEKE
jgi:hypothetical protein